MRVRIITPKDIIADLDAKLVTLQGSKGCFGVMDSHMNFITNIGKSLIKIEMESGNNKSYYVHGGVSRIQDGKLDIFTEFTADIELSTKESTQSEIDVLIAEMQKLQEGSLQMEIFSERIARFESLKTHLKY